MYHFSEAIQDTKGNAFIGSYVRVVSKTDGSTIALYSDASGTPIESVSGVENMAKINSDGNAQFYVNDGDYHVDVYATNRTSFQKRYEDIPMVSVGLVQAATVAELALMGTTRPAMLTEEGREGIFFFRSADLSASVSSDPQQNTYVAPSTDDTGASGAWVRASGNNSGTAVEDHSTIRLTGCQVAYDTGLTLVMSAGTYKIDGVQFAAAEQSITLDDADDTDPRIDVLYLDTEGVLQKITGEPAETPSQPQTDPTTQLYLTFVQVPALATQLSGIDQEQIYDEGSEWTITTSGTTWSTVSTSNPNTGTKCVEATALSNGAYVNFATTPFDAFAGDGLLQLFIRSKGTWNRNRFLRLQWHQGSSAVGNPINIRDGVYAFDSSNTSSYQMIILPKSVFGITPGTNVSALRATAGGSGGSAIGFHLDSVMLQTNNDTIQNPNELLTQADADARYLKLTGGTLTGALNLPANAYNATTWNGSLKAATEDAVRDAIEAVSAGVPAGALIAANNLSDVSSAATSRTNLGVGTGDSPQFTAINLGHASDTTLTRTGAGDIAVEGNAVYRAGGTDVPVTDGGTGASTASGARTNLGLGSAATFDEMTAAQYRANTADKIVTTDTAWAAADLVALTPGTNVAVDMSTGLNFSLAMGGNYTLDNPTNAKNGQDGMIVITQDGTGSRTLAYGSNWKFAGGTDPVLSTAAGTVDVLFYKVVSSTVILASLAKAFA